MLFLIRKIKIKLLKYIYYIWVLSFAVRKEGKKFNSQNKKLISLNNKSLRK